MKFSITLCLGVLICLIATFANTAPVMALEIVGAGGVHATIVTPDQPIPAEAHAAAELQYHVEQSTGVRLPIVVESEFTPTSGAIFIGSTRAADTAGIQTESLAPNACRIVLQGGNLFIAGRDSDGPLWSNQWTIHEIRTHMGTLFGVYEFLEKQIGVKWIWPGPGGEVIPHHDEIRVDAWDQTWTPPFIHTRIRDHAPSNIDFSIEGSGPITLWSTKSAAAEYRRDQGIWLRRQRFAMSTNLDARHSFQGYWDEFGKLHPEYFNELPDGTRRSDPTIYNGSPEHLSMCVSEPGLWRAVVDRWRTARTAEDPHISAGENDNPGKCTCARCMAWDLYDPAEPDARLAAAKRAFAAGDLKWYTALGSVSDRYARFYLALQEEARQFDPDVIVKGFAYENYVAAPRFTKLNRQVLISFVPGFYYPWTDAKRDEFRAQWTGWSKADASMMLRPNYFLDGHNMPVNFARQFGEDFAFAAANNLMATDFDSLTGQWAAQGPNLYVLARLHIEPTRPVDEILAEYYDGFGPAADNVRGYFEYWESVNDHVTDAQFDAAIKRTDGNSWWGFIRLADSIFTPGVLKSGWQKLDAAKAAARGNATAEARVAFLEAGLRNAELTLSAQKEFRIYQQSKNIDRFRKAVIELDSYRKSIDPTRAGNLSFTAWAETNAGWDRSLVYAE